MPAQPAIILSTSDYFTLEAALLARRLKSRSIEAMLRRKLRAAIVTLPEDIGRSVVMTGRRVRYSTENLLPREVMLTAGPPRGNDIPLLSPRGIALIGMSAGQSAAVHLGGAPELLSVEAVDPSETWAVDPVDWPAHVETIAAFGRRAARSGGGHGLDLGEPGRAAA